MHSLNFTHFSLIGADASKFLQGQITLHTERLASNVSQYTVVCDLKGRVQFGLWLNKHDETHFDIVVVEDQSLAFEQHIRKYGAFAKIALSSHEQVFPTLQQKTTIFSTQETDTHAWQHAAIQNGQAWISQATAHAFQPQELRLHQRHAVEYDKGCYLGQEVIARLWFKAQPKQWLHLIEGLGPTPEPLTKISQGIQVVNSIHTDSNHYQALVIARPNALEEQQDIQTLTLPEHLSADVARPK